MRALTITQPWATLIAIGAKRFETRSWRTNYRGRLVIHAAMGFPKQAADLCRREPFATALARAGIYSPTDLARGVCLATCRLIDCIPTEQAVGNLPAEDELAYGDYSAGRWAWHLTEVTRLAVPIPARGALGLWLVPADIQPLLLNSSRR